MRVIIEVECDEESGDWVVSGAGNGRNGSALAQSCWSTSSPFLGSKDGICGI